MKERRSDRWLSVMFSVLVHAAIVGALAFGWWRFRQPVPAPQALAIEGVIVPAQSAARAPSVTQPTPQPAPQPAPEPSPPVPAPAPVPSGPTPEELAAQKQVQERQEREQQAEKQHRADEQRRAEEAQAEVAAKADAAAKAEAAVKAAAESARAAAKAREEAAAKAKEEAQHKAQELAQQKAQQDRQQRQAELLSQMAVEEHLNAAQSSGALAQYQALIRARIERAWIRPSSAHAGIDCEVRVTQIAGGEVTAVQVGACNGDESVRQSIEAAVYRASPLPPPPDPALFDRNLVVNFRPHD